MHFLGNDEFEMKIVDLSKSKIHYPIDIHDSDSEDTQVVYENNEHAKKIMFVFFMILKINWVIIMQNVFH